MKSAKKPVCDGGAYLLYVTPEQTGFDNAIRKTVRFLIIAATDEVVNGYTEKDAELNQRIIVRLISANFPA